MPAKRIVVYICKPTDRPSLRLEWVVPGTTKRKGKSAGTADLNEAERLRAELEYELNHGLHVEPSKMTWGEFRKLYFEEKLSGVRDATVRKAGVVFDRFERLVEPKKLADVDERTLSQHTARMRASGRKPATIQGHLAYLRAAFKWAALQKLIPTAPRVVMPKAPKRVRVVKIDEKGFRTLLKAMPGAAWTLLVSVAWYTGMRRNEILELAWNGAGIRIDLDAERIWIPAAYNKSDEDQWLPIHPDLGKMLQVVEVKTGPLFTLGHPGTVSRKFTALAQAAGLDITLHDLRRSFGSRYASVVPAPVLQRLMRHANIQTTLNYYTDVEDALRDAIRKA